MNTNNKAKLLTAKKLANILEVSKRTVFRLNTQGKIPEPVKIGGSVRWIKTEIDLWINSGCPDRETWEAMKMQAEN